MARCFIENDDKGANLLQVLHLRPDQVLVPFDAHYWNPIVSHIAHDFADKLSELVMSRRRLTVFTALDTLCTFLRAEGLL